MTKQSQPLTDFRPKMQVCVGSVVLRKDKVLFVRQTYGETLKGKWTVPWGSVQGEDPNTYYDPPHVAAMRETLEEAGVVAEVDGLLGIQYPARSKEGDPRLYLLFLCHHVSGEPTPDSRETDHAAYFSLEELRHIQEDVNHFCYWLATRVLQGQYAVVPPEPENPYAPHLAFLQENATGTVSAIDLSLFGTKLPSRVVPVRLRAPAGALVLQEHGSWLGELGGSILSVVAETVHCLASYGWATIAGSCARRVLVPDSDPPLCQWSAAACGSL